MTRSSTILPLPPSPIPLNEADPNDLDIETLRQANIQRNKASLKELGIFKPPPSSTSLLINKATPPSSKKRKFQTASAPQQPSRTSARIANAPPKAIAYLSDSDDAPARSSRRSATKNRKPASKKTSASCPLPANIPTRIRDDIPSLIAKWTSYTPTAPLPTRSEDGTLHFPTHPSFTPNKTPPELLREGIFGGSYFRPLFSRTLGTTLGSSTSTHDWSDLPSSWYEGLDTQRFLTSGEYRAEVNKYGVKCGQSIEEWEAQGWINHEWDPRGWFQWYCRFYLGRRTGGVGGKGEQKEEAGEGQQKEGGEEEGDTGDDGAEDARQVSRWERCVGPKGRWRRVLLKKYVQEGVRECFDYGDDEEGGGAGEVSPVVHQTCFQWGYEYVSSWFP